MELESVSMSCLSSFGEPDVFENMSLMAVSPWESKGWEGEGL